MLHFQAMSAPCASGSSRCDFLLHITLVKLLELLAPPRQASFGLHAGAGKLGGAAALKTQSARSCWSRCALL